MSYIWKRGDVFTNGQYTWQVVSVTGERAVLQSLTTDWAHTIPLTYEEWNGDNRWRLASGSEAKAVRVNNWIRTGSITGVTK